MQVVFESGAAAFERHSKAWSELSTRARSSHPFNSLAAMRAYQRYLYNGRSPLEFAFCFADSAQTALTAVLPLEERTEHVLRWKTSPHHGYLARGDLLWDEDSPDAIPLLLEALYRRENGSDFEAIRLCDVPEASETLNAVAAQTRYTVTQRRTLVSPYLQIKDESFEEYYARAFGSRARQQDRRRRRQLSKDGEVQLRTFVDRQQILEQLPQCFSVEDRSWKGQNKSSITETPGAVDFVQALVAADDAPYVSRLFVCTVAGELAAFLLGFMQAGTFFFYKTGYDPKFERGSPGRMVLLESIAHAFETKCQIYDFMGAPDAYKLRFTETVRPHVHVLLHHQGLRSQMSRVSRQHLRPFAKRFLSRHGF